jgi:flagellar basal-body rod protein FlgF
MVRGIYTSAAGMITQYKKIDVLGNNISNVNTAGYKQSDITLSDFGHELATRTNDDTQVGDMPLCVVLNRETADLSAGTLKNTGINTDLAIDGEGFFAVRSPAGGDIKYTRSGVFSVDALGRLALPTGEELLSQNGTPLYVGGNNFTISQDGTVRLANGTTAKVNVYTSGNIQKRKDGFFNITGAVAADGSIKQGWLEDSNTDIIDNITGLMASTRNFQGCQQAFKISNSALDRVVTEIGSLK